MSKQLVFRTDSPAVTKICESDPVLAKLISAVGQYTLELRTDHFSALARAVVGQQISVKAARTIWQRMITACGEITPEKVLSIDSDELRSAGLSKAKMIYIKDLSEKVLTGEINLKKISLLNDEEIIATLIQVRGIGSWTAEMFLIFTLGRLNVLAVADGGLKAAVKWLYRLESPPTRDKMLALGKAWEPYRSVASLYLWEAVNRRLISPDG
jgi:DNA-3-methyladenine glycosylase II